MEKIHYKIWYVVQKCKSGNKIIEQVDQKVSNRVWDQFRSKIYYEQIPLSIKNKLK